MTNKIVLENERNKTYSYSQPLVIFDYDMNKEQHKCFSLSSFKYFKSSLIRKESKNDLRSYKVWETETKIMLNSGINIPNKYLKIFTLTNMIAKEKNIKARKNLESINKTLLLISPTKIIDRILEQYNVIYDNIKDNPRFKSIFVEKAHRQMIDGRKQYEFCEHEILQIKKQALLNRSHISQDPVELNNINKKSKIISEQIADHPVTKAFKKYENKEEKDNRIEMIK